MAIDNDGNNNRSHTGLIVAGFTVVLLLLAVGAFLSRGMPRHQQAKRAAHMIQDLGGQVSWNPEMIETLIRDRALSRITDVHFANPTFPDEKWLMLNELPQPFGLQVSGKQFNDASLECLKEIKLLRYLVVSGTNVTDNGVAGLVGALPGITVMFDYPGDPNFRQINARTLAIPSTNNQDITSGSMSTR